MLLFHTPIRQGTLVVLRFPFTVVKACVRGLVTLPRLPTLSDENTRLRAELIQRQLDVAQLREALRHSQAASALAEAIPSGQGVVAAVIARSPLATQHTVWIDRGRSHGLALEGVVVEASGVVGRIVELHPATSLVMLLTDPESRVAGLIERSRETGLLVGLARGQCDFIYLTAQADVQEGDRVVTAGLGGPFPKGLTLGTVTRVIRDEQAGGASARVAPGARLGQLEEVLCLFPRAQVVTEVQEDGVRALSPPPPQGPSGRAQAR